jgi:hypothetical protein
VPERIDKITIATGRDTLTMPWSSRVALLDELQRYETGYTIRDAFTAVGASSPVRLTNEQKTELLRVIDVWSERTEGGMRGLPEAILALRNALIDDLDDAEKRQAAT